MTYQQAIIRFFIVAAILGMALPNLIGCRQRPDNSVFTFLFPEEIPTEEAQNGAEKPDEIAAIAEEPVEEEQNYLLVSHKPYIERKCVECHKDAAAFETPIFGSDWDGVFRKGGGMPGPLTLPVKKLCLKCHKDLAVEWAAERGLYLHKTAAEGDCVKCHVPHQGRHPFRLIDDTDQLCINCHNAKEKIGIAKCVKELNVTGPCLSCHNAHLGISKALLKKDFEEPDHTVAMEPDMTEENLPGADGAIPEQEQ